MDDTQTITVGDIKRLTLARNETLVIHVADQLTDHEIERIRNAVHNVLGHGRVLITAGAIELSVIADA